MKNTFESFLAVIAVAILIPLRIAIGLLPLLGVVLASVWSYGMHASVPWAMVAAFFNWFYVIYHLLVY